MSAYRALAPAKVNLGLFVGPVRAQDGRHELVTVMQVETPLAGRSLVAYVKRLSSSSGWSGPVSQALRRHQA